MRIIAVSHLTKNIIVHRYGVSPEKVTVVYNGIESENGRMVLTSAPGQGTLIEAEIPELAA